MSSQGLAFYHRLRVSSGYAQTLFWSSESNTGRMDIKTKWQKKIHGLKSTPTPMPASVDGRRNSKEKMEVEYTEDNPPSFYEAVDKGPNYEDQMLELYKAAMSGSVATLTTLLQKDPLILHKVSLTHFTETPLHLSALAGHLDFTTAILEEKPEFASQLDSLNRSPLHLASAEGHEEIVKALLLRANPDACLVPDEEGRIPLHLAAMRGHVGIIQELIRVQPDSIETPMNGETVLHLCVRYNKLKAQEELVMISAKEDKPLDSTDHEGNTILQLC